MLINMPKKNIKNKVIAALKEDILFQSEIAKKFDVSESYVSQIKTDLKRQKLHSYIKFLYNLMNTKMTFKNKPTQSETKIIKEVAELL